MKQKLSPNKSAKCYQRQKNIIRRQGRAKTKVLHMIYEIPETIPCIVNTKLTKIKALALSLTFKTQQSSMYTILLCSKNPKGFR